MTMDPHGLEGTNYGFPERPRTGKGEPLGLLQPQSPFRGSFLGAQLRTFQSSHSHYDLQALALTTQWELLATAPELAPTVSQPGQPRQVFAPQTATPEN
ncbi:hypothetical protein TREES_T100007419 [Tupaia chinensis]|uniref:Uncharacterized protein n=1 Tax=Tupaia chinensis TaxID=246437 RepID=L9L4B0_TUPCH|nr:hypothetical protein TREES_T100007419 [Tupaia chinensis]